MERESGEVTVAHMFYYTISSFSLFCVFIFVPQRASPRNKGLIDSM